MPVQQPAETHRQLKRRKVDERGILTFNEPGGRSGDQASRA